MDLMELLNEILIAIVTACIPVLAAYLVQMIRAATINTVEDTENVKAQAYIEEISEAIAQAVSCTSQTYVDALKDKGEFSLEAQKEALRKSMETAKTILSPAALEFIGNVYGDFVEYMTPRIEAEVRKQKKEKPVEAVAEIEIPDTTTTAVAASTAAATAATIAQTAIGQINAEAAMGTRQEETGTQE